MSGRAPKTSFFAALRRDSALFALVGALALLLGMLQPVAAARVTGFEGLFILCRTGAPSTDRLPAKTYDCPLCASGHLCKLAGASVTLAEAAAPLSDPHALKGRPRHENRTTPRRATGSPPSIRAPPRFA